MANNFKKFIKTEDSGARKKERIRQEKKQQRKETKEYFEKKKQEAREMRAQGGIRATRAGDRTQGADTREEGGRGYKGKSTGYKSQGTGYKGEDTRGKAQDSRGTGAQKPAFKHGTDKPAYKPAAKAATKPGTKQPQTTNYKPQTASAKPQTSNLKPQTSKPDAKGKAPVAAKEIEKAGPQMPLNKYIAHSGICSRRDAAEMVKQGKVKVNGQKIIEPGHKVSDKDDVNVNGKKIAIRRNLVYILLNKPKDFLTTTEDPQGRKTVLDIVKSATTERVYPIGRLDRNTTGVLLLTNDGELAQKLSHPSYEVRKIYEVKLDKPVAKKDMETIMAGITLEDGAIKPDALAYADPKDKSIVGIEIHSGRNRIVRRIFEHLGYDVRNLDRVMYANLTKKNVDRGKWRILSEKEVRLLKFLNRSYTKK